MSRGATPEQRAAHAAARATKKLADGASRAAAGRERSVVLTVPKRACLKRHHGDLALSTLVCVCRSGWC